MLTIPGLLDMDEVGDGGTLFRARQEDRDRLVAVRLVGDLPEFAVTAAQALSRHPNAVTVEGSGTDAAGQGYLLLELLENGSLGDWVAADGRLPWADVLGVGSKIAGAIETAHRAGVVHGDLRPDRILVSPTGEPRLAGLELAVLRHAKAIVAGVPQPAVGDDVLGLGATLLALLTAGSVDDGAPGAALEGCGVPEPLGVLVCRCLAGDPADRPGSVHEIAAEMVRVSDDLGLPLTEPIIDHAAASEAGEALRASRPKPKPIIVLDDLAPLEPWPELDGRRALVRAAPLLMSRRRLFRALRPRFSGYFRRDVRS